VVNVLFLNKNTFAMIFFPWKLQISNKINRSKSNKKISPNKTKNKQYVTLV